MNATQNASQLNEREIETLQLISNGKTQKEISQTVFITTDAIKKRLQTIFKKLNAQSSAEAVAIAFRQQLIR